MDRSEIKVGDTVTLRPGLYEAGKPMLVLSLPGHVLVRCRLGNGDQLFHPNNLIRARAEK